MARGKRKTGLSNAPAPQAHTRLAGFEPFKDRPINTIADLGRLMEEFGIYRIYIKGPNSRSLARDTREAEDGKWEVGVKMNSFIIDYQRSGGCTTIDEAFEAGLGIKVASAPQPADEASDDGLLV